MKVNKTQALMFILMLLLEKKKISKDEVANVIEISDLKFHRYMQELRAFIFNFNLPYEINYERCYEIYVLKSI